LARLFGPQTGPVLTGARARPVREAPVTLRPMELSHAQLAAIRKVYASAAARLALENEGAEPEEEGPGPTE